MRPGVVDRVHGAVVGLPQQRVVGLAVAGEHCIVHGHLDVLADARRLRDAQCSEQRDGSMQRGSGVRIGLVELRDGLPRVSTLVVQDSGDGVNDGRVGAPPTPGRVGAEAVQRQQDGSRIGVVDRLPRESQPREYARSEVLDDGVADTDELPHDPNSLGLVQIHRHRTLADVHEVEEGRHPPVMTGSDLSHHVALGWLDLDDLGTHVAKDPADVRPSDDAGQVEDPDASQGSVCKPPDSARPGGLANGLFRADVVLHGTIVGRPRSGRPVAATRLRGARAAAPADG